MRLCRGRACGRGGGIDDHAGAAAAQPGEPHRHATALRDLTPLVASARQAARQPAPAAMKPRQPAIGMAQRAQRRRDAFHRAPMRILDGLACVAQGLRRPCEQREHLQQFLGVAARDGTAHHRSARAHSRASAARGGDQALLPFSDTPAWISPVSASNRGQSGRCRRPAPRRNVVCRASARKVTPRRRRDCPRNRKSACDIQRIRRRPAGPGSIPAAARAVAGDPLPGPVLRRAPCAALSATAARSSSQPKPCNSAANAASGGRDVPDRRFRRVHQMPRNLKAAGADLLPAGRRTRCCAARAAGEFRGRERQRRPARGDAVRARVHRADRVSRLNMGSGPGSRGVCTAKA